MHLSFFAEGVRQIKCENVRETLKSVLFIGDSNQRQWLQPSSDM